MEERESKAGAGSVPFTDGEIVQILTRFWEAATKPTREYFLADIRAEHAGRDLWYVSTESPPPPPIPDMPSRDYCIDGPDL